MKISSKQSWIGKLVGKTPVTKRQRILNLFTDNIGYKFSSTKLHATFGSSFRTRVSELNRDPDVFITIKNHTTLDSKSTYWAELDPRIMRISEAEWLG